jgi:hypothetical protein
MLALSNGEGSLVLSWSTIFPGFTVETTTTIGPAAWQTLTNAPSISLDRYVRTNSDQPGAILQAALPMTHC